MNRTSRVALVILFIIQFALSFRPGALAWDGAFYYATARSLAFDRDLHLGNDLLLVYEISPGADFVAEHFEEELTPTGRVASPFPIGASLLWLPWLAAIAAWGRLLGWIGLGPATLTGIEWPFVWGAAAVTCVYGWLAILAAVRLARRFAGEPAALLAGATAMFTTPLWYYGFREPFYAHAASALMTALFVTAWWQSVERGEQRPGPALGLGLLGGLAALVRPQNVTYLILPVLSAITPDGRQRRLPNLILTLLGALLTMTPQFIAWQLLYGRLVTIPQGPGFMDWRAPWVREVLFSPFHGLLPWMPLVVPALFGLARLARRVPRLVLPLLLAFLAQVTVNGCVSDWFGGGGYGPRRFDSTLVILIVGYAALLDGRKERWYRALTVGLSGLLVLHQWLIMRYGFDEHIGGQVTRTSPACEWQVANFGQFVHQLAGYIPPAIRQPLQTLILPGSPLSGGDPVALFRQFALLAAVLAVVWLLWTAGKRLARSPD